MRLKLFLTGCAIKPWFQSVKMSNSTTYGATDVIQKIDLSSWGRMLHFAVFFFFHAHFIHIAFLVPKSWLGRTVLFRLRYRWKTTQYSSKFFCVALLALLCDLRRGHTKIKFCVINKQDWSICPRTSVQQGFLYIILKICFVW